MSHSRTVLSAEPLASTLGMSSFQARQSTASVWPSAAGGSITGRFDFFFFLPPVSPPPRVAASCAAALASKAAAAASAPASPSTAAGSSESMTSRFQISMKGWKVPTATKLRPPPIGPLQSAGGTPIHARHSGKTGRGISWCTYRLSCAGS